MHCRCKQSPYNKVLQCSGLFFKREKASARASSDRFCFLFCFSLLLIKSLIKSNYQNSTPTNSEPPNHTFSKNSNKIPEEFPKNSDRILKEFPKNFLKNPQKFPKNSPKIP